MDVQPNNPFDILPSKIGFTADSLFSREKTLSTLLGILCDMDKYSKIEKKSRYLVGMRHPFDGPDNLFVACGDIGASASIHLFIKRIAATFALTEGKDTKFVVWCIPTPDNSDQHMLIAEARAEDESLLCGGMTDFSGEGGYAARTVLSILKLFAEMYTIPFIFQGGTWEQYDKLCDTWYEGDEDADLDDPSV